MSTYYHDTIAADSPILTAAGVIEPIAGGAAWLPLTPGTTLTEPTLDTGDYGYQLDGMTNYASTPGGQAPTGSGGPFTVELWIVPNGAAGILVGQGSVGGVANDFTLAISAGGQISLSLGAGDVNFALSGLSSAPGLVKLAVWNHVVVTFDGYSTAYLFINGVGVAGTLSYPYAPANGAPLLIGAMGNPMGGGPEVPTGYFGGGVADIACYSYPLSQFQVCKHIAARNGTPAYPNVSTYTGDYYPTILADNPSLYYRMDETAGALAVDRSGNGNNGAYGLGQMSLGVSGAIYDGNPAVLLEEPDYMSFSWDATPAGIITPARSISFDTEFSVEAWVYLTSLPPSGHISAIASTCGGNPVVDGGGFQFYVDDAGYLWITMVGGTIDMNLRSAGVLPAAQYNYVCVTWDLTTVTLYVEGVYSSSATPTGTFGAWSFNLCFGFNPSGYPGTSSDTGQLAASLDEPAIYNHALAPGRVDLHYKAGIGPLTPPVPPVIAGTTEHFFLVLIYDTNGNLVDIPQADIESLELSDTLNGGSSTGTLTYVRGINEIGAVRYLWRVHVYIWSGLFAQPTNPTWSGYMVDIDQEKTRTSGKITVHLEGDQKQLDRGVVYEDVNPLVNGNPAIDAADYIRHLNTTYAPPGFCILSCPPTLFPLLPGQYQMMQLGDVIDTVLKTGRDDVGNLVTWRVWNDSSLVRTLLIEPDQNPNTVAGLRFIHIFMEECAKYEIHTKYSEICNVVTVQGGQDYVTGEPVVGSFIDEDSVAAYGPWEQIISVWQLIDQTACDSYAETFLDIHGNPQANGKIELHNPDPRIHAGVWIQVWENAKDTGVSDGQDGNVDATIKQMRVASVKYTVGRSRIVQELSPVAPTPYLDYAVYKMGLGIAVKGQNQLTNLPVNTQNNFVRSGGQATHT